MIGELLLAVSAANPWEVRHCVRGLSRRSLAVAFSSWRLGVVIGSCSNLGVLLNRVFCLLCHAPRSKTTTQNAHKFKHNNNRSSSNSNSNKTTIIIIMITIMILWTPRSLLDATIHLYKRSCLSVCLSVLFSNYKNRCFREWKDYPLNQLFQQQQQ